MTSTFTIHVHSLLYFQTVQLTLGLCPSFKTVKSDNAFHCFNVNIHIRVQYGSWDMISLRGGEESCAVANSSSSHVQEPAVTNISVTVTKYYSKYIHTYESQACDNGRD
jgi:hypothetical protein